MRNRLPVSFVVLTGTLAAALVLSPAVLAQTPAQPGSGTTKTSIPDLSGVWGRLTRGGERVLAPGEGPGFAIMVNGVEPEMLPEAAAKYKAIRSGYLRNPFDRGHEPLDPTIHCLPYGPTRAFTVNHPFEIVQTPGVVYILFESGNGIRRVYMNQEHPEGMYNTYMGHSTGKYEGDALVVDTIALNGLTWIDTMGHPQSDAMHIVERIRRVSRDILQIDFTFEDPKTYAKPWNGKRVFQLAAGRDALILESVVCEDHLLEDHLPRARRGEAKP